MENTGLWTIALLTFGIVLVLWKQKREYQRTNRYGIQQYGSFWNKFRSDAFDNFLMYLGYVSIGTGGFIFIFVNNSAHSWVALLVLIIAMVWHSERGKKS